MTAHIIFDGETFVPSRDGARLRAQLQAVFALMKDGLWRTLAEIQSATSYPQASISARLRDFRKEKCGSHTVERMYLHSGIFCYRLLINKTPTPCPTSSS